MKDINQLNELNGVDRRQIWGFGCDENEQEKGGGGVVKEDVERMREKVGVQKRKETGADRSAPLGSERERVRPSEMR